MHDPETYVANLVTLLCGYPLWAGEKATATVKRQTKFPPTEAELYPALEDQVKVHRYAKEFDRGVEQMVERRALLDGPKRERESLEDLRAKYGDNWGISNPADAARRRAFRDLDELRHEYGAEMIDAIPDAKDYDWVRMKAAAPQMPNQTEEPNQGGETR